MIGSMRHRVEIQSYSGGADSMGGRSKVYTTVDTIWGNIMEKTGREGLARGKISDTYSHTMTCRFTSLLTSQSRVKYGNRVFNVVSVINPDGRNKYLDVVLLEGAAT